MSSASPRKSTRAAATRRKAPIIDDSEGEENQAPQSQNEEDSEDFTPAPVPPKRARGRPKKNADASSATSTPKPPPAKRRRARATESAEASESIQPTRLFSPPSESVAAPSPAKSPRKRTTASSSRRSRASKAALSDDEPQLPTPQPSESPESKLKAQPEIKVEPEADPEPEPDPESTIVPSTPLTDITETAVNEQIPTAEVESKPETRAEPTVIERVNTQHTVLERPIDIVNRKRAAGLLMTQESNIPKQRTVINWLILTNFKSYAGIQEVGPFHASFSSVVGPNGSGKSNVIDSLLFVFGFRASKMRQGKISALIHNSAAFPDLDYCEVAVHFEEVKDLDVGGSEIVPNTKLIVSRRAFKNNSSKYYINNKESNFYYCRGVDLDHKRFLILQGEVESIAQMKPKAANEHEDGLLEYLEDIIGTSQYKTPIEEATTRTEELNDICAEKKGRVEHVERERNGLEDKKNKALAFIRDENELATKQSTLYQIYISEFDDHIQVTGESVAQMQAQLDEELQKHQGNEEGIKQLEKQYKKGSKDCEQWEKQAQELQKEVAKIDKDTLEKTKDTSKHGISECTTLAKQYASDLEAYADDMAELEQKMRAEEKELEAVRATLSGKTQDLSDQIAAKQKSLEPWSAKINEKQSAIALSQSELDILREKENAGAKGIAEVEAKITTLQESKQNKAEELEECKAEKKRAEKEAQKVQSQLDQLAQQEPILRSKLSGARQNANEARASLSATQTQSNVLDKLMRLKDQGRISGFHGRLGNLGAIDQRYDIAISTACPALDHFVVDSAEVGEQCIDYLRKNNLGRGTFRPLNRQRQHDLSQIETPENVPRLFDLVTPKDDKFRLAFYNVLQDTLVAKDLEQANRVAYSAKRWRVVTLSGELIETSGTMSGGGTRVEKGKMSSKLAADVTSTQVAKLEQDRDALEQSFAQLQQEQRDLETQLRSLHDQIPQLETKAQKIALELESFDRNIADSQRRIKELSTEQASVKSDKARISALEKSITSAEKEVSRLHAETAEVEDEIKALQDKIMEIGGAKLRIQNAKVTDLKGQIDSLADMISNAEVSKSKEEKQLSKHEKAHADAIKELEKLARDAQKIEADLEAHNQNAAGIRQQAEEAQDALEARKEELQALKTELDEKTAQLNETRAIEIEMRNKLEEGQKTLNDFKKKQAYFEDKRLKLSYQNISDLGEEEESEGLPEYTKDELEDMDKAALKEEIEDLEKKNENVTVDLAVLAEYRKRTEEHAERSAALTEVVAQRDESKKQLDDFKRRRLEGFMEGFYIITARLKEMYHMITMGGNAELELVDSLDPFTEGVEFSVMPPKKSWKKISNLSGGEKTLSSLALVFALHHYKPTPLYVMDEIDAALDFRNVSIVASYIQQRTKNAQFIVISLRNNMFELAARLVGVYKVNHMTKSVTIENKDYIRR
ncbi:Structural maintenance of chromosomes protein 4 [Kalmusia sp. IMI 367209]|nr:Structural maintenance of chromosomes protein 4 [Kalmusia sp. IMI 367209]